jgi:predicted  nucleic acid-binding Zn-ribbon protein
MLDRGSMPDFGSKDHEYYSELCALATSGTLTDQEWNKLRAHIAICAECNAAVLHYREIARTGMALLMPDIVSESELNPQESWSSESVRQELFGHIARGEAAVENNPRPHVDPGRAHVSFWQVFPRSPQGVLGYALALILLFTMMTFTYHLGTTRTLESADAKFQTSTASLTSLRAQVSELAQEREALGKRVEERTRELVGVSEQLQRQTADAEKWRGLQAERDKESAQHKLDYAQLQTLYRSLATDRDEISRKLQGSEATLQLVQQKYEALRSQHSAELLRAASLETRITELSTRVKEAEGTVRQQQQFLASDRDIRELMGARSLFIADVYDVNRGGGTQKSYGRVFYTAGKSLIFYAYDLDQQPNLRNSSIFQVWGRRGMADKRPLNMGIFYLDSDAKKRWVLKFDDPEALAQIDAVFVTVEPSGGSKKPSGRQLLFASLRNTPNHP